MAVSVKLSVDETINVLIINSKNYPKKHVIRDETSTFSIELSQCKEIILKNKDFSIKFITL